MRSALERSSRRSGVASARTACCSEPADEALGGAGTTPSRFRRARARAVRRSAGRSRSGFPSRSRGAERASRHPNVPLGAVPARHGVAALVRAEQLALLDVRQQGDAGRTGRVGFRPGASRRRLPGRASALSVGPSAMPRRMAGSDHDLPRSRCGAHLRRSSTASHRPARCAGTPPSDARAEPRRHPPDGSPHQRRRGLTRPESRAIMSRPCGGPAWREPSHCGYSDHA